MCSPSLVWFWSNTLKVWIVYCKGWFMCCFLYLAVLLCIIKACKCKSIHSVLGLYHPTTMFGHQILSLQLSNWSFWRNQNMDCRWQKSSLVIMELNAIIAALNFSWRISQNAITRTKLEWLHWTTFDDYIWWLQMTTFATFIVLYM